MHDYLTSRVSVSDKGCWLWKLSVNHKGYAQGRPPGSKYVRVHRWSYEQHRGPIPAGWTIDHLCRVRRCVNPDHLEPVTNRENSLRSPYTRASINAAKTHCVHGHPFSDDNTYVKANGTRACRTCVRACQARHRSSRFKRASA